MSWSQADWLSAPTALTSFVAIQEWEAGSLVFASGSLGLPASDLLVASFVKCVVFIYLGTPAFEVDQSAWAQIRTCLLIIIYDYIIPQLGILENALRDIFVSRTPSRGFKLLDSVLLTAAHTVGMVDFFSSNLVWSSDYLTSLSATPTWMHLMVSLDPILTLVEVFFIGVVCVSASRWVTSNAGRHLFYDDLVTLCKYNNISVTELAVTATLTVGFVFFDIFLSFAEDDVVDTLNYLILLFVILTFVFLLLAVDIQYFFMISNAGGDFTLRVIVFDLINNLLCALRVFFCWIRYIFYDLQVEMVDMTFQYTDSVNETSLLLWFETTASNSSFGSYRNTASLWTSSSSLAWAVVATFIDIASYILQALTGLFKLVIASFLLWLIVDLFLLRGFALEESQGLTSARSSRGRGVIR